MSLFTGWEKRDAHLFSADFFNATEGMTVTFLLETVCFAGCLRCYDSKVAA
jgi:polyisoprenoid-binding protein YceI